ncbi:hypothetical protein Tco_0784215 [Tanacetum coccineum]
MGYEPEPFRSDLLKYLDILDKFIDKKVLKYGELWMKECEVKTIKETEKSLNEAILHEHEIEISFKMQSKHVQINPVQAVDANLVITESSGIESENNSLENALSKLVNETQMQMQEGKVDIGKALDAGLVGCQVTSPLLNPSPDNMITEGSNQSLESENTSLKKTIAQFQKYFSRMETHCVNLELKYQNQALKSWQHGQILNETSNKAKIKSEIDVLETINIELEYSVAKLLAVNEKLHMENEHLKQTYKDLYDSIKKTRIQEKVFANVALKNKLRKLKGNSMDIKFAKSSILGKLVLQPSRNQVVVFAWIALLDICRNP